MDVVPDGLTMLLWMAAVFTILPMWSEGGLLQRDERGRVDLADTLVYAAWLVPFMYASVLCLFSFIGGGALLAKAGYTFLKYGEAHWHTVAEVWRALDTRPFAPTGWTGFDGIVDAVLSWPASPALMVGAIVAWNLATGVLLVPALIYRLVSPPN